MGQSSSAKRIALARYNPDRVRTPVKNPDGSTHYNDLVALGHRHRTARNGYGGTWFIVCENANLPDKSKKQHRYPYHGHYIHEHLDITLSIPLIFMSNGFSYPKEYGYSQFAVAETNQ